MKNMGNLMKQVQEMGARVNEARERLASVEISGSAGAGMVTVVLDGLGEARKVTIDPSLLADGDAAIVEDLVLVAFNDARDKSKAHTDKELSKVAGGLDMSKLPFPF